MVKAQEYAGITGMMHVPTAEMAPEGEARVGAFFLSGEFLPDRMRYADEKYGSWNHFLAITPFSWIELAYVCTLMKGENDKGKVGYNRKDRHFAVKLRPLKEGRYWPAIAIGAQDPGRRIKESYEEGISASNSFFQNFYVAASKHVLLERHELGIHLTYRYYSSDFDARWRGVVGGITYRPAFARNLRAMVEYTGDEVNVGVDCLLWKHLFLQACLQDGKHFSGGIILRMSLFGRGKD